MAVKKDTNSHERKMLQIFPSNPIVLLQKEEIKTNKRG